MLHKLFSPQRLRRLLVLVPLALPLFLLLPAVNPPSSKPFSLTPKRMAQLRGGVEANVTFPSQGNWYQSFDNLRFSANVTNAYGTPTASLLIAADNSKVGSATVSTPSPNFTGTLNTRTIWPFPGKFDMQIQYVDPDGNAIAATGDSLRLDQYLHPDVKVHTIKFWNSTDPSGSVTSIWSTALMAIVDRITAAIPDSTSNTIDGIYAASCPTTTKTQWRYAGLGTINFQANCSNIALTQQSTGSCLPQVCINEVWNRIGNDPANVHVVVVDNIGCGWAGLHGVDPQGRYMILVEDDAFANEEFITALLAHELGHTYVGGHSDNTPGSNCTNGSRMNRNVMCSNVGRLMTATQCESARTSTRYQDRN